LRSCRTFWSLNVGCSKLKSTAPQAFSSIDELMDSAGFTGFLPFALLQFVGQRCDAAALLQQRALHRLSMKKPQP
jgi:hypothetical protein